MSYIQKWSISILILFNCTKCSTTETKTKSDLEFRFDSAMKQINEIQKQKYSDSIKNATEWEKLKDSVRSTFIDHSSLSPIYESVKKGVFFVYTSGEYETKQGSAFLIGENGVCVSNYHVFEGTNSGFIKTSNGDVFKILKILKEDEQKDYVIFQAAIPNYSITPLMSATEQPKVGDQCFAIGNPLGLSQTLSTGIISGFRNNLEIIQTTAEITHGSSGGALFNNKGEVIGITTSGYGEANLNFAINMSSVTFDFQKSNSSTISSNILSSNLNFMVISDRAYFYNEPNEETRRRGYLVQGNQAVGLKVENGFVYIDFTNAANQNSKGWIRINDISFQ